MTTPFAKPSEHQGGTFFKVKENMQVQALLIEPLSIAKNVENNYNGTISHRDEVTANVSIFRTSEDLDNAKPSEIQKAQVFTHPALTSTLGRLIGGAMVGQIEMKQFKKGSGYAFRDAPPEAEAKIGEYYSKREAEVAEALANVPSFD